MNPIKLPIIAIVFFIFNSCEVRNTKGNYKGGEKCIDANNNSICDSADTDGDGLTDEGEKKAGTNPDMTDSDGDSATDLCEIQYGTNPNDASSLSSICLNRDNAAQNSQTENLMSLCMLHDERKKQDQWFNDHHIYDSCGFTTKTIAADNGDKITLEERIENCKSPYDDTNPTTLACNNYGDPIAAELKEFDITIKIKLLHRALIIIQNGVISISPWYDWYSIFDSAIADVLGGLVSSVSIGTPTGFNIGLGPLYSALQDRHFVGAIPGSGGDCGNEDVSELSDQQAIVTVNGVDYNWWWTGFVPFKILEYQDQYVYANDCIMANNLTNTDKKTFVRINGATYNNFSYPTHIIEVKNEEANRRYNNGCREVKVHFSLAYYKEKSGDYEFFETDTKKLDEMCKDILPKDAEITNE